MDDPKRIDGIVDDAMTEILGPAGNAFYAELVRQTQENRLRIEHEVRGRFQELFAETFGELTGLRMPPDEIELAARMEANRRIRAEIARRVSEEEQAFRQRVNNLCGWAQEQKRTACSGCESPSPDEPR
jgi:hypothetical protein